MANYIVQEISRMPKSMRFRVVKTKMEVGLLDAPSEVVDPSFEVKYFADQDCANIERSRLIKESAEPIYGAFSLLYVSNNDVSEWLYESGRLVNVENHEAWFDTLTKAQQSEFKIDFVRAKAAEVLEQAHALGFNTVAQMKDHEAWLQKHGTKEYLTWVESVRSQNSLIQKHRPRP